MVGRVDGRSGIRGVGGRRVCVRVGETGECLRGHSHEGKSELHGERKKTKIIMIISRESLAVNESKFKRNLRS